LESVAQVWGTLNLSILIALLPRFYSSHRSIMLESCCLKVLFFQFQKPLLRCQLDINGYFC
jgi:hypothetical protein